MSLTGEDNSGEIDLRIVDAFSRIVLNTMPCHTDRYPFYEPPFSSTLSPQLEDIVKRLG